MTPTFAKFILILFTLVVALYGLYLALGSLRNWNRFVNSHKRLDLTEIFGDFGRILYVVFGLAIFILATLSFFGLLHIGPFSHFFTILS